MLEILNIKVADEDEQDLLNRQMILIADLISRYHSKLTIPEIKEAFKMYAFKKFPEVKVFRLVDCVAVGEILNAYIEFRNQAVQPFLIERQKLLNAPIEKSQHEKDKIFHDFSKMVYDEVKEKQFCDEAWYLFKKLEKSGVIVVSNEEKQSLYEAKLQIYITEEKLRIKKKHQLDYKFRFAEFEKTYTNGNKNVHVQNLCRSILVSKYILSSNISFDELLTFLK